MSVTRAHTGRWPSLVSESEKLPEPDVGARARVAFTLDGRRIRPGQIVKAPPETVRRLFQLGYVNVID